MSMSGRRKPLIAGNWKMNGSLAASRALVAALAAGIRHDAAEMLICPPFVYLDRAREWIGAAPISLGAQNLAAVEGPGAYTGEVSGSMLRDLGCRYVIVGHSERRTLYGESDRIVVDKFRVAQASGLVPILCVGENLDQRERGETDAVVSSQVAAVIDGLGVGVFARAVVAYEPIWAIGTGRTATPGQAQEVHARIRGLIASHDAILAASLRILYGGSVKGSNAADLLCQQDIDGGLVGGASLDAADFLAIFGAAAAQAAS
jgi:triosephosphate isomerase (TIM)